MKKTIRDPNGIRAILFDCNGVIADDEPIHLRLFQKVLAEESVPLTVAEYYKKYLAMDDRACFTQALKEHGQSASPKRVMELIDRKAEYYKKTIVKELKIFPGVKSFAHKHARRYTLAVVSGALRHEIDLILDRAGITPVFHAIVSARDVKRGKPHPEGYLLGYKLLNRLPLFRKNPLKASECLAIEDSIHGVESAQAAGMKCLAVTNSYSKKQLRHADAVVSTLVGVDLSRLRLR
jgi:HAD superfamily hydrolase (TIGR01509 family)